MNKYLKPYRWHFLEAALAIGVVCLALLIIAGELLRAQDAQPTHASAIYRKPFAPSALLPDVLDEPAQVSQVDGPKDENAEQVSTLGDGENQPRLGGEYAPAEG